MVLFISIVAFLSDSKMPSNHHPDRPICHSVSLIWDLVDVSSLRFGLWARGFKDCLTERKSSVWDFSPSPPGQSLCSLPACHLGNTSWNSKRFGNKTASPCQGPSGFLVFFPLILLSTWKNCNKLLMFDVLFPLEILLSSYVMFLVLKSYCLLSWFCGFSFAVFACAVYCKEAGFGKVGRSRVEVLLLLLTKQLSSF